MTATDAAGNSSLLAQLLFTISAGGGLAFDDPPDQTAQAGELQDQSIPITGLSSATAALSVNTTNAALFAVQPVITGTGLTRAVTFRPAAGPGGAATITVTATEGAANATHDFVLTVVPDEPPTQTLKFVNLDTRALAAGQPTFEIVQGTERSTGLTGSVRGLALATGSYTLRAPAGCTTCAVSLSFTVAGRCDVRLP